MENNKRKLRIAVIGTRGFPGVQGGIETHCENLYPSLSKVNCVVTVFTRKPYVNPDIDKYKGVSLIPLSCPKNKFIETFFHTFLGVFAAKRLSVDILHIHAIGPALFTPVARLLGLKVIMTTQGSDYERKKWGKFATLVLKLGEKWGSKWANGIIGVSESIAENIRKRYYRKVTVIPNGVTIPESMQSDRSLREYGLTKGEYILSVGRLVPEKGFHDLIEAFNGLNTKRNLVIVGGADHEDKYSLGLKEMATKSDNIIFTGFLTGDPLQELFSYAALFVIPSYHEGLPLVLLEALSYGLSCIASGIPANREVGLLAKDRFFQAGDVNGLAKKINEFVAKPLTEEERITQLSGINEKYNWDKIAQKTLKVYESIL